MSWLERVGQVIRANVNHLIREAQDPEQLLEQAIAQMEQELVEMRRALASAIATYKSTERQVAHQQMLTQRWYESAQMAIQEGNEPLARTSLMHRQSAQDRALFLQEQLQQQQQHITKFKQDLRLLEQKFTEAKAQKSIYIARLRSAMASKQMQELTGNLSSQGTSNIFEQIEAKILELEAESELLQAAESDPIEEKFAALEGGDRLEAEMAKLKAQQRKNQGQGNLPTAGKARLSYLNPEIEKLRSELDSL